MMRVGWSEVLVILIVAFFLFGTKRVNGLGKALGTSIREFKEELHGDSKAEEAKHHEGTTCE
jgi:sec-independent protein translocase protein TatA